MYEEREASSLDRYFHWWDSLLSEYLISGSWKLSVMFQYIKFMFILNELDMSVSVVIAIY